MRTLNELGRLEVSAYLVDARGRACPQPIIDLAKALRSHALVELWADDAAAEADVKAFVEATGYELRQVQTPPLQALVARV